MVNFQKQCYIKNRKYYRRFIMSYEAMVKTIPTLTYDEQVNLMSIILNSLKNHKFADNKANDFSNEYPEGFFDLFGSDPNYAVSEPEELDFSMDAKREAF